MRPSEYTLSLDAALADLRARCRRRKRGRIVCTVEIEEGVVVQHRCEETEMTERDLERVMSEKRAVRL
ncbi:MAG: hypothetical protein ACYC6T_08095 [Thermoleophilia bacterium]